MQCAGAPAALNTMQLALHKDEDGSYRKLECDDIVTKFSLEDLVSCTFVFLTFSFCLDHSGYWNNSPCMALSYALLGRSHLRFRGSD